MLKTFSQLAPQWYMELKTPLEIDQNAKNSKLDIGDLRCCIVGEVYGFLSNYGHRNNNNYCYNCSDLSGRISCESPLKRDNPVIIELINHINESHPKLMKDKKC